MKKRYILMVLAALYAGAGFLQADEPLIKPAEPVLQKKKAEPGAPKKITVVLKSGVQIVGTFFEPKAADNLTFVLLHGLGSNRYEWKGFADKLHALGYGVFVYDARGHGDSNINGAGSEISYKTFLTWGRKSEWQLMPDDLDEVLLYLEKLEGVDPKRFVLGGASLGANVALSCASRRKNIRGLILLSPGIDYAGIASEYPMRFCRVPRIAVAASPGDAYAYKSSQKLAGIKKKKDQLTFFEVPGSEHGVNMFKRGFDAELLVWIREELEKK